MTQHDLNFFKNWFSDYCKSFCFSSAEDQKNISLKEKHSYNVCENIVKIADEQQISQDKVMIAESTGLFHDLGRFFQYARYKTFNDSISVNHGRLSAEILQKERVLINLPENEQRLISNTVKFHNALKITGQKNMEKMFFLKLLRDADKLDIWRVFDEYYAVSKSKRASVAAHGLPDTPEYSVKILSCLFEKKMASFTDVRTLNDFKLLQLSWIYDLNFNTSYKLLLERDYIKKFIEKLPDTDEIKRASSLLHEVALKKTQRL